MSVWRDSRAAVGKQKSTEMGVERERKGENKYIKMNRERAKMRERQKEIERDIEMCVGRLAGERLERERGKQCLGGPSDAVCLCLKFRSQPKQFPGGGCAVSCLAGWR